MLSRSGRKTPTGKMSLSSTDGCTTRNPGARSRRSKEVRTHDWRYRSCDFRPSRAVDFRDELANMAMDSCGAVVGAGHCLSTVVTSRLPRVDALWDPREPDNYTPYPGHSILSCDITCSSDMAFDRKGSVAQKRGTRIRKLSSSQLEALQGQIGETFLMLDLLKDLWAFMRVRKKLWLAPIIIIMVLLGGLLVLAQGSAIAPFIYTLF